MRKQELISRVAKKATIKTAQARAAVNEMLDALSYALKKEEPVGRIKTSILKSEIKPKNSKKIRGRIKRKSKSRK